MATLIKLKKQANDIVSDIYRLQLDAEENRKNEHIAAVTIQSWYRGIRDRCYIKHLSNAAVALQSRWRGFVSRQRVRRLLSDHVKSMCNNYYHYQAAQIQKMWRGFYVRKYVFDYYSRKQYLESLVEKNNRIRAELAEFEECTKLEMRRKEEEDTKNRLKEWASRHHYLISTQHQPGVFNSPYKFSPLPQEHLLNTVRPRTPPRQAQPKGEKYDPAWKHYGKDKPNKLPPLPVKPQGPFKDPEVVQNQRYKPFNPSLRVMTDLDSVAQAREQWRAEEWVGRVHDKVFLPVCVRDHKKPYEPMLNTTTQYGHIAFGNVHFREVDPSRHVTTERFRSLVPPVPVFSKLNNEYIEGYVEN